MKQLPKKEREELFLPKNLFCCFLKFSSKICETRSSNFKSKVANETGAKQEPFLRQTFNEISSLNAPDMLPLLSRKPNGKKNKNIQFLDL